MTNACEACGHVKRVFFFCPACGGRFEVRSETSQRIFCCGDCIRSVPPACATATMHRSRDGDATGLAPGVAARVSPVVGRGGGQEPGGDA